MRCSLSWPILGRALDARPDLDQESARACSVDREVAPCQVREVGAGLAQQRKQGSGGHVAPFDTHTAVRHPGDAGRQLDGAPHFACADQHHDAQVREQRKLRRGLDGPADRNSPASTANATITQY